MNRKDQQQLSEQYRQVPRVESPEHLDKRILDAAHKSVPEKRRISASGWFPVLATACVAGAVFYIATPLFEAPSYQPPAADSSLSDAIVQEEVAEAEAVEAPSAAVAASPAATELETKRQKAETALRVQAAKQIDREITLKQAQESLLTAEKKSVQSSDRSSTAVEFSEPAKAKMMEKSSDSASAGLFQDQQQVGIARARNTRLTAEEIAQRIQKITALANEALTDDAQRLLDELIAQCPQCDIPVSLSALNDSVSKVINDKPASTE